MTYLGVFVHSVIKQEPSALKGGLVDSRAMSFLPVDLDNAAAAEPSASSKSTAHTMVPPRQRLFA